MNRIATRAQDHNRDLELDHLLCRTAPPLNLRHMALLMDHASTVAHFAGVGTNEAHHGR